MGEIDKNLKRFQNVTIDNLMEGKLLMKNQHTHFYPAQNVPDFHVTILDVSHRSLSLCTSFLPPHDKHSHLPFENKPLFLVRFVSHTRDVLSLLLLHTSFSSSPCLASEMSVFLSLDFVHSLSLDCLVDVSVERELSHFDNLECVSATQNGCVREKNSPYLDVRMTQCVAD